MGKRNFSMTLKLYGVPLSPFARMAHAVAELTNNQYEYVKVDMSNKEHKSDWYLKMNPQHKVPVLKDGDFTLTESHAIMQYLCERDTSVKSCQLYPKDLKTRAKIDEALCRVRDIKFFNFIGFLFGGDKTSAEKIEEFEKSFETFLEMHPDYKKTGYLIGDKMTIADIALDCRMSIPRAAGYKFEKFPGMKKYFELESNQPYYQKVNAFALEKAKAN